MLFSKLARVVFSAELTSRQLVLALVILSSLGVLFSSVLFSGPIVRLDVWMIGSALVFDMLTQESSAMDAGARRMLALAGWGVSWLVLRAVLRLYFVGQLPPFDDAALIIASVSALAISGGGSWLHQREQRLAQGLASGELSIVQKPKGIDLPLYATGELGMMLVRRVSLGNEPYRGGEAWMPLARIGVSRASAAEVIVGRLGKRLLFSIGLACTVMAVVSTVLSVGDLHRRDELAVRLAGTNVHVDELVDDLRGHVFILDKTTRWIRIWDEHDGSLQPFARADWAPSQLTFAGDSLYWIDGEDIVSRRVKHQHGNRFQELRARFRRGCPQLNGLPVVRDAHAVSLTVDADEIHWTLSDGSSRSVPRD